MQTKSIVAHSYSWLTLVEILIAIFVFGIGILSVLTMITQSIATSDRIKHQTQATLYAKEWIELIYHLRDTNIKRAFPRNCIPTDQIDLSNDELCDGYFLSGDLSSTLTIAFDPITTMKTKIITIGSWFSGQLAASRLYTHSWWILQDPVITGSRVNHDPISGLSLPYGRYISFSGAVLSGSNEIIPSQILIKVQSIWLYQYGAVTGTVLLESFIANYQ